MDPADRIANLEEQVAYWKSLAKGSPALHIQLRAAFPTVPPQCAAIVAALYQARGRVLPHNQLLEILESRTDQWSELLRTQVCRLRHLMPAGSIVTVRGEGYCLTSKGLKHVASILYSEAA